MSLSSFSLKETPTVGVTGTDDITVVSQGGGLNNLELIYSSDSTYATRRSISLSFKPSKALSTGANGFSQARNTLFYRMPITPSGGNLTTNTAELRLNVDPLSTSAEITAMLDDLCQLAKHADMANFWLYGSTEG